MSGPVGDNVYRASGVIAASGGGGGAITWSDTVQTSNFSADAGSGYFINTTSGAVTVTLPGSPSAGDTVALVDYAGTADTNAITIDSDGGKIQGESDDFILKTERVSVTLVWIDSTQ